MISWGSVGVVQSTGIIPAAGGNPISKAFVSNTAAGDAIIAYATYGVASGSCTFSDNQGNGYVTVTSTYDSAANQGFSVGVATNIAAAATTVTATCPSALYTAIVISESSGVATASPVDVYASSFSYGSSATNGQTSSSATTTQDGELIYGAIVVTNGLGTSVFTAGTNGPYTMATQPGGANYMNIALEYRTQTSQGDVAAYFTDNAVNHTLTTMVTLKPSALPTEVAMSSRVTTGGSNTTVTSYNLTDTNTNDLVVISCVGMSGSGKPTWSTVTTNSGLTIALATASANTAFYYQSGQGLWYACTAAGGFTDKTFTCTEDLSADIGIIVKTYSGTACTNATPSLGIGAVKECPYNTGTSPSCSVTTTANNSLVIGNGSEFNAQRTISAASGQTLRADFTTLSNNEEGWDEIQNAITPNSATSVSMQITGLTSGDEGNMGTIEILAGGAPPPTAPTVISGDATNIGYGTVTSSGNVTSTGGSAITERGICYGLTVNPDTSGTHQTTSGTTGSFTIDLTGLIQGRTYFYRAYATNGIGTSYGSNILFTTLLWPVVNTTPGTGRISTTPGTGVISTR
jgi:hypothetical protein